MIYPALSVCIATHRKASVLDRVLSSIFLQTPPFDFEVVVVVDYRHDPASEGVVMSYLDRYPGRVTLEVTNNEDYRNPALARNLAMKRARGDVLVLQSDDVMHQTLDCLENLARVRPDTFNIGTVYNQFADGTLGNMYTGLQHPRPLFFLGSVLREDIHKIGGNDEEFTKPGYDDDWLGSCLVNGAGLLPVYRYDVFGGHQDHPRPDTNAAYAEMRALYHRKVADATAGRTPWQASGGPWPYTEGKSYDECHRQG